MNLVTVLEYEEGYRSVPYLCSEDYVTFGYGTKLHKSKGMNPADFTIKATRDIAKALLLEKVTKMELALASSSKGHIFEALDEDRRAIILSMSYQMGVSGVLKFPAMWRALEAKDWEEAGVEALDSLWAKQTPARAGRHARVLSGETLKQVY